MYDAAKMADAEQQALRDVRKAAKSSGPKIALPNGVIADAVDYINFKYGHHDEYGHLANGKDLLEKPKADCIYAWPKLDDPNTVAKMRQNLYRPVHPDELKADAGGAIRTHEGVTGKYVCWYGHVLVEIGPKAHEILYGKNEKWAVARLAQNTESFQEKMSQTRGIEGVVDVSRDGG